jgi:microcompartment protein CcmK/EutM
MEIGVVIGTVVSTIKHPVYKGRKLLLVESVDVDLNPVGNTTVCIDSVDAGVGDVVLVAREGKTAGEIMGQSQIPARSVIVGVIDRFDVEHEKVSPDKNSDQSKDKNTSRSDAKTQR